MNSQESKPEVCETEGTDPSILQGGYKTHSGDFHQSSSLEQRQTMMLGNDEKTSGSDLLTLAEKYLQSNKQMTDKHYSSATYE